MAISGYDPDNIPVSVSAPRAYDDDTGILTPGINDQPMDEEEFRSRVRMAIEDAATYIDTYIAPERENAMSYYLGNDFGDEEEGRSQVVMTEVRDTVLAMLPSLLRIFTGGDIVTTFVCAVKICSSCNSSTVTCGSCAISAASSCDRPE